ncbi:hybrid sensor histidine kinase/response regulator, partial [Klebsiella pneumoniae]|nr:hybrid sensor histidine kinase/response regulator [Klebsiella pneumoniae]
MSDPFRIAQITENLVTNAIKYTDKGHITINAFLEGDRTLVIEVEDTGRGIPKDKLKSIFLPFIRVADGVKVPGFGMGLAIVMGVVKTMNGRISVKSELGLGSLFRITLPVKKSTKEELAISDVIRNEGFTANDLSILIIDDDELVCESLASILQGIFQVEY